MNLWQNRIQQRPTYLSQWATIHIADSGVKAAVRFCLFEEKAMLKLNKELLLPNAKKAHQYSHGGHLLECQESLKRVLTDHKTSLLSVRWHTDDPYNAGQAVTLLEMSGYSFHLCHQDDSGYSINILTSLRANMHYIEIDPIEAVVDRVSFEQGRYDTLMKLLGD